MKRRDPVERFWSFVDKSGDCWIWLGARNKNYGRFNIDQATPVWAHRFSYELLIGPIPSGLHLDHLCRNPPCVNPSHLEPVTVAQNLERSGMAPATVNSRKTHCPNGHEYAGDNVRWTTKEI